MLLPTQAPARSDPNDAGLDGATTVGGAHASSGRATLLVLSAAAGSWRRYPRPAFVALASLVVQQAFFTGFAFSLKYIVDDITNHRPASALVFVLALLLAGFVLAAVATVTGERAAARAGALIVNGLRRDLYDHLLRLSPAYFLRTPPGKVLKRFTNDLKSLEGGYVQGFLDTVVLVVSAAITVPLLFWLDWRLALITCLTLPVVVLVVDRLLIRSVEANDELSASELDIVNTVQDTIRAQQVVRTFHLENLLTRRFEQRLAAQQQRSIHARVVAATVGKGASLGVLFVQLVVIVVGAELAANGVMTIGALVAFITVLSLLAKNVYDFAKGDLPLLAEAHRSSKGINELFAEPVVVTDPPDASQLPPIRGTIAFDAVSFAYVEGKQALTDVSFEVAPRTSVAVVGSNGSGKTTLLNLIERFYDPQHGAIRVDGRDIRDVSQRSLRSQMSAVLQGNFLFNDTIMENIRVGNPEASDQDIVAASRRAELHDFVMSLPQEYQTLVGESGGRLSGGQRQRIAIARAMLREPRILLLDEVTTALDPTTEASINEMLARVGRATTTISVTHRLAAARTADQIFVLEDGRLVERGTHDDLLAAHGLYSSLWEKQSGFEVSGDGRQASVDPRRLRGITLFTDLTDDTLARIAVGLTSEYYEADQTVFTQGEPGDRFYLIARGRVEVVTGGFDGEEHHLLEKLGDGDHFGELALLQDRPRTATIRTIGPSVFLTMGRDAFLKLVASTPEMARELEQRMARSELNLSEWKRLVGNAS